MMFVSSEQTHLDDLKRKNTSELFDALNHVCFALTNE